MTATTALHGAMRRIFLVFLFLVKCT